MINDDQKLEILTNIYSKLVERHAITSYEYEIFQQIKQEQNDIDNTLNENNNNNNYKKVGQDNNLNEELISNRLNKEKIKANIEKILSLIKDKKEYEFISDFFISEFDPMLSTNFLKKVSTAESNPFNHKESNISNNSIISDFNNNIDIDESDNINEDFLKMLTKVSLTDINSIKKLNEEMNKNYKSKNSDISNISSFNIKKNNIIKEEDIFLPEVKKAKSYNSHKNNINNGLESKEEMDKELEEEINRQIFGYTKKMKESARNFGAQLKKDNQTLNKIENLQDKVNAKTTKEVKRLEEFNYSIKMGFCKLTLLILTVLGLFFTTFFIMKIFPKLA